MKILLISDVVDPLIYSHSLKERFGGVDFVLSSGDLPFYYLEYVLTILEAPLFFVRGNHDPEPPPGISEKPAPRGATDLDGRVVRYSGVLLAGLEGSMRYKPGRSAQYTNTEMWFKTAALVPALVRNRLRWGRYLDILVTHAPPRGIHDLPDRCHTGFSAFNWIIHAFKPRYLIHGHVHLNGYHTQGEAETVVEETTVINAYGHRIVTLEEK